MGGLEWKKSHTPRAGRVDLVEWRELKDTTWWFSGEFMGDGRRYTFPIATLSVNRLRTILQDVHAVAPKWYHSVVDPEYRVDTHLWCFS